MWHFIPLSEYTQSLTSKPEQELDQSVWQHIWARLFSRKHAIHEEEVEFVTPDLQSVPMRILDWVAPPPRWQEECGPTADTPEQPLADTPKPPRTGNGEDEITGQSGLAPAQRAAEHVTQQLSQTLADWQSRRTQGPGIEIILAAPHSGIDAMIRGWATRHGYIMPPLPSSNLILDPNNGWLDDLRQRIGEVPRNERQDIRIVLTGLEEYYLRHHNGLNFLRSVMDYLVTEAPPSLVVCDSWAWAYLRNALHLDAMVRSPITLARATGEMLQAWLLELSTLSHHRRFIFRQGEQVLCAIGLSMDEESNLGLDNEEDAGAFLDFCQRLAELSRGNPGIARAIWRSSMSIRALSEDEKAQTESMDETEDAITIWVTPLNKLTWPVVPLTFTNNDAFILQTLLLHDGLTRPLLELTLPLSPSLISRRLQVMFNAGLIRISTELERDDREPNRLLTDDIIEVTPLGYIPVRNFLRTQGFFIDDL